MADAVIVSTARTPIGRAYRGAFNNLQGATMGGHVVAEAVKRAGVAPEDVSDVMMGCAIPEGATGGNIARQIAVRAGLPVTVGGVTVNRFCSSGLQTIAMAAQRVRSDDVGIIVAGGLDSISLVQNEHANKYRTRDEWIVEHKPEIYWSMIQTADTVAKRYKISREAQDEYALESQRRTASAQQAGKFNDEIVPLQTEKLLYDKEGKVTGKETVTLTRDEGNRPDTNSGGTRQAQAGRWAKATSSQRATQASSPTAPRRPS